MSQGLIRAALEVPLAAWAAAKVPPVSVSWENVAIEPQAMHIRANLLPAQTLSYDLLGKHRRYQGIFQVTLVMPTNVGMSDAEDLITELEALYPQAALFFSGSISVLIDRPMSAAPPIFDDGQLSVPVYLRYLTDTTTA